MSVLIDDLLEELSSLDSKTLSNTLICVPSLRLASYILATLAKKYGAFSPPTLLTLDNLISSQLESQGKSFSDSDDVLVLFYISSLLQSNNYTYLKPHDLDAIFRLFSKIETNGSNGSIFKDFKDIIQENCFQTDISSKNLFLKIDELQDIYKKVKNTSIKQSSLVKKQKIDEFLTYIKDNNLNYSRSYFISPSFYSKEYQPIFDILKTKPNTSILELDCDLFSFEDKYKEHSDISCSITGYKFRSIIQETHAVSSKIKQLINYGIAPSGIGVILMNEKLYTPILKSCFEKDSIPYNFTSAVSVKNSSLIIWISMFFSIRLDSTLLYDFLTHPLSVLILSFYNQELFIDSKINEISSNKDINSFFSSYSYQDLYFKISSVIQRGVSDGRERNTFDLIRNNKKHQLYRITSCLFDLVDRLNSCEDLAVHFDNLRYLYDYIDMFMPYIYKDDPYNLKAQEGFHLFIDYVLKLSKISTSKLRFQDICGLFSDFINKSLYWTPGQSLTGVQVLKLPESICYPFTKLFILGCNSDNDLVSMEEVLPSFILEKKGLTSLTDLKKRQRYLYSSLFCNSSSVDLSCIEEDSSNSDISAFVQILDLKSKIHWYNFKNYFTKSESLQIESGLTDSYKDSQSKTSRINILTELSPTLAQYLIDCPYKFFIRRHIKDNNLPTQDHIYKTDGTLFHRIFELFIKNFNTIEKTSRKTYLDKLCQDMFGTVDDTYYNMSWCGYLKFIDFIDKLEELGVSFKDSLSEYKIPSFRFKIFDSFDVNIQGIIDRLDFFNLNVLDEGLNKKIPICILTDYKSSSNSIPKDKEMRAGKISQLIMYASSLDKSSICGYWDIKKGLWHTSLVSKWIKQRIVHPEDKNSCNIDSSIFDLLSVRSTTPTYEDSKEALIDVLEQRIKSVLDQGFYKDSSSCDNCYYKNICQSR